MAFSIEILILILITLVYFNNYFKQRKIVQFFQQFPHDPYLPLLGNALDFKNTTAYLKTLDNYVKKYGGIVSVKIGLSRRILVVSDYNFVESILSSSKLLTKSTSYKFLDPWLGDGLLNSTAQNWKAERRLMTPAFHPRIIKTYVDLFDNKAEILLKKLKEICNTTSVDIVPFVTLCSLDIACESATGVPSDVQNNDNSDYVKSVKQMCSLLIKRSYSVIKSNNFLYNFTNDFYRQKHLINVLHGHSMKVIEQFFQTNTKSQNDDDDDDDDDEYRKSSFLSTILKETLNNQPLTLKHIREQIDGFVFAAHDTTASGLNFTIYALANHPDVQLKVFEEQRTIFNNDQNATVTFDKLQEMEYLEMAIKEALRVFSPVPAIGRRVHADVNIKGLAIPKGVDILLYIRSIHMNPELYPEPEKFDPNRFSSNVKRSPYSFIPFSAGPRNCLGQKFAMLEMKAVLSKLIRNFEFFPALPKNKLELASEMVLTSKTGVKIGFRQRTQQDFA